LLHSFEPAENALDWEIGVHGIRLFVDGCSSTFLPEVAKERNCTKEETLAELAKKGGFRGTYEQAAVERSRVQRYQSAKCVATWDEYQQFIQTQ
jgi:AMMECR1 domain-containing protein